MPVIKEDPVKETNETPIVNGLKKIWVHKST